VKYYGVPPLGRERTAVRADRGVRGRRIRPAGEVQSAGYKFGRWIDTVRMQRALGAGDATPPTER